MFDNYNTVSFFFLALKSARFVFGWPEKSFCGLYIAHTSLLLTNEGVRRIIEFFRTTPDNADVVIKNDRMLMRVINEVGLIKNEIIPFLKFEVYDYDRNKGHIEVDLNLKCITIEMTRNEGHNKDFTIDREDSSEKPMSFLLDLYENDKDEYYYGGHIALYSPFFYMDRDILIDNDSAESLKKNYHVFQEVNNTISFCPLGELIDLQFIRNGESVYASGSVSDFGYPMLDYYFNQKIEGHILDFEI